MAAAEWTLEELTAEVASALNGSAYAGAPNGRVREVPDARAVRWYTTIGLVDRPAMRGRTALYGPRHLLQLVAIKRRQSQGFKIADIQAELANAPDEALRRIAELPEAPPLEVHWHGPGRRFWVEAPAEHRSPPAPVEPRGADLGLLSGVPLGGGAVLLLPTTPTPDDLAAIRTAADELMTLLDERGLLANEDLRMRGSSA